MQICLYTKGVDYGVATISRLLKIICLFCKRALFKRRYSAKETYDFKEPTNRSHSICMYTCICVYIDAITFLTRRICTYVSISQWSPWSPLVYMYT